MPAGPIRVGIIVPAFNEEAALPRSVERLLAVLTDLAASGQVTTDSAIYFVDDGSTDRTWAVIEELSARDARCHGIKLSRNHGHQHALLAGLLSAPGDALISIDADLQDDETAMKGMVAAYIAGADIVYGVRRARHTDTWFKRVTARGYYRFAALMGVRLVYDHADYRLLSRRAITALAEHRERNVFLRGLIPQLGFNTATVYYDRGERVAGISKYPVGKMLALAFDGITSFSAVPLKLITFLGILVALSSFCTALWAIWVRIFNPAAVPGWASTVIPISLLGGIQLLCTGIIGQYLAKVYLETKQRPRAIVEKEV